MTIPIREVHEQEASIQVTDGNYALFAHQRTAAREISDALAEHPRRVILHMPTGAGKTRTAMNVIADHLRSYEPTLVIWLANTEELCEQSAAEFEKAWSYLGNREVGVYRFWGNYELTLLKKGHFAENLTRYHTTLNLYDPLFSGHIEFFQRSHKPTKRKSF